MLVVPPKSVAPHAKAPKPPGLLCDANAENPEACVDPNAPNPPAAAACPNPEPNAPDGAPKLAGVPNAGDAADWPNEDGVPNDAS